MAKETQAGVRTSAQFVSVYRFTVNEDYTNSPTIGGRYKKDTNVIIAKDAKRKNLTSGVIHPNTYIEKSDLIGADASKWDLALSKGVIVPYKSVDRDGDPVPKTQLSALNAFTKTMIADLEKLEISTLRGLAARITDKEVTKILGDKKESIISELL